MKFKMDIAIPILLLFFNRPVLAQAPTVGNGSAIVPSASRMEKYGINGLQETGAEAIYSTRHYRRENRSGIGGSFLQTASPTSESSPAMISPSASPTLRIHTNTIRSANIEPIYSSNINSPALQSFSANNMSESRALSSPTASPPSFSNSQIESLSSFNKRPSALDQFNNLGSGGKLGF
jgi:hypothetical protein